MTKKNDTSYPFQLRVLGAFLIFFAIRDFFGVFATYGQLRGSGIAYTDIWDFSAYPHEASLYMSQHLLAVIAVVSIITFLSRSKMFPWVFLGYYVCIILIYFATIVFFESPAGLGGIIGQTLLCVPWLVYVFKSKQARNVFA